MIRRSPHPDVEIPDVALTPFIFSRVEARAEKAALVDGATGRTLTYGELYAQARRLAAGLARAGLGRGDVLGLALPNVPEYPVVFHAVSLLGGATTTLNPIATAGEMAQQLLDALV